MPINKRLFKKGDIVTLNKNSLYIHQLTQWKDKKAEIDPERHSILARETYIRIKSKNGYSNVYPKEDLILLDKKKETENEIFIKKYKKKKKNFTTNYLIQNFFLSNKP